MRKDRVSAAPRQRLGPPGDDGWLPYGNPRAGEAAAAKEQAQPLPGDRICPECGGVNFKGKRGESWHCLLLNHGLCNNASAAHEILYVTRRVLQMRR